MGMLGDVLAGAVSGYAGSRFDDLGKELQMEREQAMAIFKEQQRREGRQADIDQDIANSSRVAEAEGKKQGIIDRAKVDSDKSLATERRQLANDDATSKANNELTWRKAHAAETNKLDRDKARATHIESASSIAQAALANFQLDRAKLIGASQDALALAEKSGDKKAIDSARKQLSALNSKGDNPRDAQTMISAQNAYLAAAKAEDDPEKKAELMASAKTWGDLAAKEMNSGGGGDINKLRELRDGGAKSGGASGKATETVKQLPAEQSAAVASPAAQKQSGPSRIQMEMQLSGLERARSSKLSPSESAALEAQIKSIKDKLQSM